MVLGSLGRPIAFGVESPGLEVVVKGVDGNAVPLLAELLESFIDLRVCRVYRIRRVLGYWGT